MRRTLLLLPLLTLAPFLAAARPAAPPPPREPHRSPLDLAVLPDGRALTANSTSDSVSLVDLGAARVLSEIRCGRQPAGVAVAPDGKRAAVSHLEGTVTLFDVLPDTLRPVATFAVGPRPRGLAFASADLLFVAVSAVDEVVTVDVPTRKVTRHWPAPREPYSLALSPDRKRLAAGSGRSGHVRVWEVDTGKLVCERRTPDAFNLRGLSFTRDGKDVVAAHATHRDLPVLGNNIESGWVIDNRLSRHHLEGGSDEGRSVEQVALDPRGNAVADLHGLAFDPSGKALAVTASGVGKLLLYQYGAFEWVAGVPGDTVNPDLLWGGKFRRVRVGGRPLGVAWLGAGQEVAVANYLLDAVQVVDTRSEKVVRTISLGGPVEPDLARKGEALFHDARRSRHNWFSCHTCHPDGHTSGQTFDTLNDDSYGNAKLTPSLRGVARTGPWTWHGWQKSLDEAVAKSFADTLHGKEATKEETRAVVAFLSTLEHPPSPHRLPGGGLTPAAKRGETLFGGKARCAHCHQRPEWTSPRTYDVKLQNDGSPYEGWNPPSLRGLWDRGPFLHDGRSQTLEEVLKLWHAPEKLGGAALTAEERADLIAFLRSL